MKPRGKQVSSNLSQNQRQTQDQNQFSHNLTLNSNSPPSPQQHKQLTNGIELFSMADRYLYKSHYLGKVIDHLAKIYNEKTGQKIIVIFRKMIDEGTNKDKKIATESG
jgi:transcription initiation factor TFIID subunit TAF12